MNAISHATHNPEPVWCELEVVKPNNKDADFPKAWPDVHRASCRKSRPDLATVTDDQNSGLCYLQSTWSM
eukprot:1147747-Pelagomonas_calceolata.AAC.4